MKVLRALDRHWFAPARSSDLAIVRMLVVGFQLFIFLPGLEAQLWQAAFAESLFRPIPTLKILMLPFGEWGVRPEPMFLHAVWLGAVVTGITALVGLYTRPSMLLFAAANTLLVAHKYSYSEYHHPEALMIMALWLLALGPSGGAYSLDDLHSRLVGSVRWMRFRPRRPSEDLSEMARWPLRTMQWLFVLVYLAAGLSKVRVGGLQWFDGHTLSYYLMRDGLRWGSGLSVALAEQTELLALLSVGSVAFELTFALAVLVPVLAWPFVLVGSALHTGIWVLQRAPFFQYLVLYVVLIESLRRHWPLRRRSATGSARAWTVVYDGLCPRCVRTMVALDYFDFGERLAYLDLEQDWAEVSRLDPSLTVESARHAMLVVAPDGTVHRGYHAFRALARTVPALWPTLPFFYLPLAGRLGPSLYDRLAARRARVRCTPEVCGPRAAHRQGTGVSAS